MICLDETVCVQVHIKAYFRNQSWKIKRDSDSISDENWNLSGKVIYLFVYSSVLPCIYRLNNYWQRVS